MLNSYGVHPNTYELLYSIIFPSDTTAMIPLDPLLAQDYYEIENIRQSENAWLLFTHHTSTNKRVVLKILRKYEDTRYKLGTLDERQLCQLEALRWNKIFTDGVYIGLARICDLDLQRKRIGVGKIVVEPDKKKLDPQSEYVLLMDELPKNRRLDFLLKEGNKSLNLYGDKTYHQHHVQMLTRYMAYIHTNIDIAKLTKLPIASSCVSWGSVEQLREKLMHNFAFVNQSLMTNEDYQYDTYYTSLENVLHILESDLVQIITEHEEYFNKRIQEHRIRRCHGDLKARNIWISPCNFMKDTEPWKHIKVLDAVDFNSVYSNIDILSDFAMLVVDVQARTKSSSLADTMIKDYLWLTKQQDRPSRLVLDYYLVEKAFVGAIVNIIYDNLPGLGLSFLDVSERRMKSLMRRKNMQHYSSTVSSKLVLSAQKLALSPVSTELEMPLRIL